MTTWREFTVAAPRIAEIFARRHRATNNLCLLATVRADGSPRISPMEPRIVADHLVLLGMPGTTKYRDLGRDPRFCLHTATVDPQLGDGDAKLFGVARDLPDPALHEQFAETLFSETGMDLRGEEFSPFYVADLTGGSAIGLVGDHLQITIWRPGKTERVIRKH